MGLLSGKSQREGIFYKRLVMHFLRPRRLTRDRRAGSFAMPRLVAFAANQALADFLQ